MRDPSLDTVWVRSLSGVVTVARQLGIAPERILDGAGFAPDDVLSTSARVPLPGVQRLFENLERLVPDDEHIGLRAAESVTTADLDVHHYAGAALGTVGKALDAFAATIRIVNTAATAEVVRAGDVVTLRLSPVERAGAPSLSRALHDYFVFTPLLGLRRVAASPLPVTAVALEGPAPRPSRSSSPSRARDAGAAYRAAFACDDVSFAAPGTSTVTFHRAVDDLATRAPDPALAAMLTRLVGDMLASLPQQDSLLDQLRAMIRAGLVDGEVSLEAAAKRLSVSARTLQRRIEDESLPPFSEIVDATRSALASDLLRNSERELADIAHELGYADVRAFHRACRRWFGESAGAHRRRSG